MTTIEQKERARKLRQFALAVSDPTSPSFNNNVDSYIAGFELTEADVLAEGLMKIARRAHRTRYAPFVLKCIAGVQSKLQAAAGLSAPEYVSLLLKREADYAKRGIPGDAAASARLLQYVGKTLGHLADKPLVDPNANDHKLLSGEEVIAALMAAAERMKRLQSPNPLPSATAEIIVEEEK